MPAVEIEYCVPCGHRDEAVNTASAILETHADRLDGVTLVPGVGGIFEVRLDGAVVLDTDEEAYDLEAIVERVASRTSA